MIFSPIIARNDPAFPTSVFPAGRIGRSMDTKSRSNFASI